MPSVEKRIVYILQRGMGLDAGQPHAAADDSEPSARPGARTAVRRGPRMQTAH
jgi:hypothetical protein